MPKTQAAIQNLNMAIITGNTAYMYLKTKMEIFIMIFMTNVVIALKVMIVIKISMYLLHAIIRLRNYY